MACYESAIGALAVIKDVILTIAAIIGSVVAILGLRTWQRQLRGATKHEIARRAMKALRDLGSALVDARHTLASAASIRYHIAQGKELPDPGFDFEGAQERAVGRFWKEIALFHQVQQEVRDFLGQEAGDQLTKVRKVAALFELNLGLVSASGASGDPTGDPRKKASILYETREGDTYATNWKESIEKALEYFRQRL